MVVHVDAHQLLVRRAGVVGQETPNLGRQMPPAGEDAPRDRHFRDEPALGMREFVSSAARAGPRVSTRQAFLARRRSSFMWSAIRQ